MRDKPARSRVFNFSQTQDKEKLAMPKMSKAFDKRLRNTVVALTIDFDDGVLYNLCYSLAGLRQ